MRVEKCDVAAVMLLFAETPLHAEKELTVPLQEIWCFLNNKKADAATPQNTVSRDLRKEEKYFHNDKGVFSLINPDEESVIAWIGREKYDCICRALREKNYLTAENKLNLKPSGDDNALLTRIDKLLKNSYQVILTGAPGTGKTFTAKELAEKWIEENGGSFEENFCQVQFHPGYDYADFIIGLKPELEDGNVNFAWKDGLFKTFADNALKARKKDGENCKPYIFLIDEINRADLSRVFGEVFSLLEEDYRYPKNKIGIKLPDGSSFVLPDNLYIIATMNDIDRSVESMDFALRRRFSFLEVKAEDSVCIIEKNQKISDGNKDKLKKVMAELNKYIGSANELLDGKYHLDLGDEYALGGAYFVHFAKYPESPWDKLWSNHLAVILNEYLRGHRDRHAILKCLKNVFKTASCGGNEND